MLPRAGHHSLRWSGGGLLVLLSLGLHGMLLGLPLNKPDSPLPDSLAESTTVIDVVRLPSSQDAPTLAIPEPSEPQPVQPAAAIAPTAPPPEPVPPPEPNLPEPAPAAPEPVPTDLLPAELPPQTLDERLRDPAAYAFNQRHKSLIADASNFYTGTVGVWLAAEYEGIADDDQLPLPGRKLPPLRVAYPLNTCLVPPPAEGVVGVIVNVAGQRIQEPVRLDSTGYTVLDEKALEMALEHDFPPWSEDDLPNPRGYWLPIQVQYDGSTCQP